MWWSELSYVIVGRDPYVDSTPVAERDPNASGRFDLDVFLSATERESRQVQRA
jgi:hypothetical protein